MDISLLNENFFQQKEAICSLSAYSDIPLPPYPDYQAEVCILCKKKFQSLINPRIFCTRCHIPYCKDCCSIKGDKNDMVCDICQALDSPSLKVSSFTGLINWIKAENKPTEIATLGAGQIAADFLTELLESPIKDEHILACLSLHMYKDIIKAMPFNKGFLGRFYDHSTSCICDGKALSTDLLCDLFYEKKELIKDFKVSITRIKPFLVDQDLMVTRAMSRLICIMAADKKICVDDPDIFKCLNTTDLVKISYLTGALAFAAPFLAAGKIHQISSEKKHLPDVYKNSVDLYEYIIPLISLKQTVATRYFASLILLRIAQNREYAHMISSTITEDSKLIKNLIQLTTMHIPANSQINESSLISIQTSEILHLLWLGSSSEPEIQQLIYAELQPLIVQILQYRIRYDPNDPLSIIQTIFLSTAQNMQTIPKYSEKFNTDPIKTRMIALAEERQSTMGQIRLSASMSASDIVILERDEAVNVVLRSQASEIEALKIKREELKLQLAQLQPRYQQRLKEGEKRAEKTAQSCAKIEETVLKKREKLKLLEEKRDNLTKKQNQLKQELKKAEENNSNSSKSISELKDKLSELQNTTKQKEEELEKLQRKADEELHRVSEMKRLSRQSQFESAIAAKNIDLLNVELSAAREVLNDIESKAESEKLKHEELQKEIECESAKIRKAEEEKAELEKQAEEAKAQIGVAREKLAEAEMALSSAHAEVEASGTEASALAGKAADAALRAAAAAAELEERRGSAAAEAEKRAREIALKERELQAAKEQCQQRINEVREEGRRRLREISEQWKVVEETARANGMEFIPFPVQLS